MEITLEFNKTTGASSFINQFHKLTALLSAVQVSDTTM